MPFISWIITTLNNRKQMLLVEIPFFLVTIKNNPTCSVFSFLGHETTVRFCKKTEVFKILKYLSRIGIFSHLLYWLWVKQILQAWVFVVFQVQSPDLVLSLGKSKAFLVWYYQKMLICSQCCLEAYSSREIFLNFRQYSPYLGKSLLSLRQL